MHGNAKKLSLGGILLALLVITLFIESVAPTNKLSLYALSSFYVSIIIAEFGVGRGWMFYFSSCLLSLILVQNKAALIPYVLFFGLYGIIKFYIEKMKNIILEYVLKLLFFNLILGILYLFFKQMLLPGFVAEFPWWTLMILGQIVFVVYDYVYSLFISYYFNKLKTILKI